MGRFLEIAKQAVGKMEPIGAREGHEYSDHVQAAFRSICDDHPPGAIAWLETADRALYDDLTCRLPQLITQQWNADAPVEEFQRVVDAWLALHRRACAVYRESLNNAGADPSRS